MGLELEALKTTMSRADASSVLKSFDGVLATGSFLKPFLVLVKETGIYLQNQASNWDFQLKAWSDELKDIKTVVLDPSWKNKDLKLLKSLAPNARFFKTNLEHSYLLGLRLQHSLAGDCLGVLWSPQVKKGSNIFLVTNDALHIPIGWSSAHLPSLNSWLEEVSLDGLSKKEIKEATSYNYSFIGDILDIDDTYLQWCRDKDSSRQARAVKTLILLLGDLLIRAQYYTGIRNVLLGGEFFDDKFFREIVLDFLDVLDLNVYTSTTPLKSDLIISQGQALQGCIHQSKKKGHAKA